MRAAAFASLIAAAGLCGCATRTPAPAPAEPGMAWSLYESPGEGLKLAFGKPGTDDVALLASCQPKSGRVTVNVPAPGERHAQEIALSSGPAASRLPAVFQPDLGEGSRLEATAATDDPALARFARSGELTLDVDGRRTALPQPAPGQAAKFMKTCRFG
jgi:hypothetical protein